MSLRSPRKIWLSYFYYCFTSKSYSQLLEYIIIEARVLNVLLSVHCFRCSNHALLKPLWNSYQNQRPLDGLIAHKSCGYVYKIPFHQPRYHLFLVCIYLISWYSMFHTSTRYISSLIRFEFGSERVVFLSRRIAMKSKFVDISATYLCRRRPRPQRHQPGSSAPLA